MEASRDEIVMRLFSRLARIFNFQQKCFLLFVHLYSALLICLWTVFALVSDYFACAVQKNGQKMAFFVNLGDFECNKTTQIDTDEVSYTNFHSCNTNLLQRISYWFSSSMFFGLNNKVGVPPNTLGFLARRQNP